MNPRPDWQGILISLRRSGLKDHQILDIMAEDGVTPDRATLAKLRNGQTRQPLFSVGMSLINAVEKVGK